MLDVNTLEELKKKWIKKEILTQEELKHLLTYIAAFYDNCGNYRSFGDTKFIP